MSKNIAIQLVPPRDLEPKAKKFLFTLLDGKSVNHKNCAQFEVAEENGPIRPTRINGRLAWSVASIRALLQGAA